LSSLNGGVTARSCVPLRVDDPLMITIRELPGAPMMISRKPSLSRSAVASAVPSWSPGAPITRNVALVAFVETPPLANR
jgi:hypothetical protein